MKQFKNYPLNTTIKTELGEMTAKEYLTKTKLAGAKYYSARVETLKGGITYNYFIVLGSNQLQISKAQFNYLNKE